MSALAMTASTSPGASSTPPHGVSNSHRKVNGSLSSHHITATTNSTVSSSGSARQFVHDLSSTTASTSTPLSATAGDRSNNRVVAPPVEIKLFVGRIPKAFDETQLRTVFSEFGLVRDVIIIRDRDTGTHRGCAFVRMASITKADVAVRQLNNIRVLDSNLGPLQVKYATGEAERLGLLVENCQPGIDQAKLFVGSLPKTVTEEDIHSVFSRFGDVDEVFVMKDEQKVPRGCAFVRFTFKEEALNAISNLNGKFTMPGGTKAIEVRFAENKKSQQQQQPNTYNSISNPLVSSGLRPSNTSGWLEYVSPEGRPYYYSIQTGHTQWERPTELDSMVPLIHGPQHPNVVPGGVGAQTHGPPGANVFIFHIPNDWSEHDLVSNFSPFGQIVSARIATDKGTGRRLGFGFVSFSTIEASVQAVMALNGFSVSGKRLKVTIKRGEEQYAAPLFLSSGFTGQSSNNSCGNDAIRPQSQNSSISKSNLTGRSSSNNILRNQHSSVSIQGGLLFDHPLPEPGDNQSQSSLMPNQNRQLPLSATTGMGALSSRSPSTLSQLTHHSTREEAHTSAHHYINIPNYPARSHARSQGTFSNFPSSNS